MTLLLRRRRGLLKLSFDITITNIIRVTFVIHKANVAKKKKKHVSLKQKQLKLSYKGSNNWLLRQTSILEERTYSFPYSI